MTKTNKRDFDQTFFSRNHSIAVQNKVNRTRFIRVNLRQDLYRNLASLMYTKCTLRLLFYYNKVNKTHLKL